VADLRRRVEEHGRDPRSVKVLQGMLVMLGRTTEEARAKADLFMELSSPEGLLTKWCGWMNVDLASYPDEARVTEIHSEGTRSALGFLQKISPDRQWTIGDVREFVTIQRRPTSRTALFGTPEQVADRMEEWLTLADIDGFNLLPCPPSSGIDDICDLLVPELQQRGLLRRAYDPAERTLRERYFGVGRPRYGDAC
jgi:alkanesulfonate monooxygenase SsuD/methylene tetrahydromethanopterin reductase-like flavin-dependent oxidoreductase (luciferase family)